ncbi:MULTISPECIES: prephenate/arogenate dehydrogenase family protein [Methylosinus]|uniref:prephenate dehydrogenase n=1 Tax=Methylosinus trichosporium (strain ATCC 35070 / NCIMB 11131 / UNIQEM 75 / OB3b) TaxID=595536 RepID=A0A2D2CZ49_METT3|nr:MULTISPECIES: prephenate/arogenate dehydrogenase family protein [Methylosinus]ATQ67985.1 cyclohexadienyl dehydrogenase [Methylosinus trichosporium OB3b]OBS53734.1 cyclohexadienyl dehydrogenase [Methylosinus sp. 3S-1]
MAEEGASAPIFDSVALIGLGLIGSSIARGIRAYGAARRIIAFDSSQEVRARVSALGIADDVVEALAAAARADLVILCVPVGVCGEVARALGPHLSPGAVLSDVGSVKAAVIAQVAPHLPPGVQFIPAHPIAGTEYSGPDAGFATLFQNRWCILTPQPQVDAAAAAKLTAFWTRLGANVETMSAAHHDLVLAVTSHLPHLIAYNIVGTAADLEEVTQSEVIKFSASGFRDFTRIAASDPTMWRDIFLNNKEAVLEMLGRFDEDLTALRRMIRCGDGDGLFALFTRTRAIRRSIVAQGQDTAAPDFGRAAAKNDPPAGR